MKCERLLPVGWIDIQMSDRRKSEPDQTTALVCCNFVFTYGRHTWWNGICVLLLAPAAAAPAETTGDQP